MQKEWGQRKIETERGDREGKRHYQQQDGSAVGVPVMGMCHTLGSLAALGQARPHRLGSHGWPHTRAGAAEPRAGSRQDHGTGLERSRQAWTQMSQAGTKGQGGSQGHEEAGQAGTGMGEWAGQDKGHTRGTEVSCVLPSAQMEGRQAWKSEQVSAGQESQKAARAKRTKGRLGPG